MTQLDLSLPRPATDRGRRRPARHLPPLTSLVLLASVVAVFLATSSVPTPLYAVYSAQWGLTPASTSLVFGVYAIALLITLLSLGRLSDHLGRRPVLVAAITMQVVAMVLFATATDLSGLLLARVLQGLSTGAGLGAIGAGMVDLDERRGTTANAIAPPLGSAVGALAGAAAVNLLPTPTHAVYLVLAGVLLVQGVAVLFVRETSPRTPGAWSSLRPSVRVPGDLRLKVVAAAPVLFALWALSGLFGALGPDLVHELLPSTGPVLGVVPLVLMCVAAPAATTATQRLSARASLSLGTAALVVGIVVTATATAIRDVPLLFAGAVVCGTAFGVGFRGGIGLVVPAAAPGDRAGTLSLLFVVSYLGFGVPAMVAGAVAARTGSVATTALGYDVVLLLLAAVAAIALHGTRPRGSGTAGSAGSTMTEEAPRT